MNPGVDSIACLAGCRIVAELAPQKNYRRNAPSQVLIADAAAESCRPAFSRQHAALPPQYLYAIDNAVVFGKGSPVAVTIIRRAFDEDTLSRSSPLRADKLFVTRADAGTRHLANHAEVAGVLKEYGFVEVAVGGVSHLEQAALFHQAREIIGLAGAALTNVLYCRGGTRMTVLAPATMPALYFWDLASHVGVDFRIGYFPALTPTRGIHSDFNVDVSQLIGIADSSNFEHDSMRARWL